MRTRFRVSTATNLAGWSFSVVLLSAASVAQVSPQPGSSTANPVFPDAQAEIHVNVPAKSLPDNDANVRLGAGDLIKMSVYGVPDLDTTTRVNNSGDLNLPLIDYVHVDGLTVDEAERVIEKRLDQGGFIRNPHVQLMVQEYTSDGVNILGEVARPGIYPALGNPTLFVLLSAAGGLSDRAGRTVSVTHRSQPDKPMTVTISRDLEEHPESNVPIYPGDTIMVRRADVIYVVGEVAHPSGFLMDNNGRLSVLQAIALAGGTNSSAKLNGARIIRKEPTGVSEVPVALKSLLQAKSSDVPLQADDILFVPSNTRKMLSGRSAETALQLATSASLLAIRP